MPNYIYLGCRENSNIIGYIEYDGSVYRGRPGEGQYVGRMENDGVLKHMDSPIGKVDCEGFIYNTWNPDSYQASSPYSNPACIGKYENGLFYSSPSPAFGSNDTFLGMGDSAFVGATDSADSDAPAAALLLLLDADSGYAGQSSGGVCSGGDAKAGGLVLLCIVIGLSGIFIGSWMFILAGAAAVLYVLITNLNADSQLSWKNLKPMHFLEAAGIGLCSYMVEGLLVTLTTTGLLGLFVSKTAQTPIRGMIGSVLIAAAYLLYRAFAPNEANK